MKDFIARFAAKFNISSTNSRAAVILYSSNAVTQINFRDHDSFQSFKTAVERLPQLRGAIRMDVALTKAYRDLFGPSGSARRGVQRIALLVTDGRQTSASDAISLDKAAEPLKQVGVHVIAVGVGGNVDKRELRAMVKKDEDTILATSFNELLNMVGSLVQHACEGKKWRHRERSPEIRGSWLEKGWGNKKKHATFFSPLYTSCAFPFFVAGFPQNK